MTLIAESGSETSKKTSIPQSISSQIFSGPIPPPSILFEYAKVIPNLPERIVSMAEQQASHRRKMEEDAMQDSIKKTENENQAIKRRDQEATRGQWMSFIIFSGLLILKGMIYPSLALGGATSIGFFVALKQLILGRTKDHK